MQEKPNDMKTDLGRHAGLFVIIVILINIVMDGLPQAFTPFGTQLLLLPITFLFLLASALSLYPGRYSQVAIRLSGGLVPRRVLGIIASFELLFIAVFLYETRHFAGFGYRLLKIPDLVVFSVSILAIGTMVLFPNKVSPAWKLAVILGTYAGGSALAILSFPLSYLRSDMLPVIFWAERALLSGRNPYQHFYVAERIYDFPYLPGTLLSFAPAQALHLDLRWASIAYVIAGMSLIYWATTETSRPKVVLLIGLFALCPYLQYRHELYTQGHFFSLIVVFVMMQRRHFAWAAAAFGLSMVISQFSWVIFPFFLLNALRRGGWKEVGRMMALAILAALALMGPFFASGTGTIAHNAVGQWDRLVRPIARPMNLSFWVSYLIRPIYFKWLQLALLSAIFVFCWQKNRCADLADTLRWMITALILFILLNVLVDGYFYLMLLVPMLVYTCVVSGWWDEPPVGPVKAASVV